MTTQDQITTTKKVNFSLTLPTVNFGAIIKKTSILLSNAFDNVSAGTGRSSEFVRTRKFRLPKLNLNNKFKFNKKFLKIGVPVIVAFFAVFILVSVVRSFPDAESRPINEANLSSPDALATLNLNRRFEFPILDENGDEAGKFEYVIESASLQKQIVVQGQRASAIEGRIFLILNLKVTNSEAQTIQLNTRDYLRLTTASKPEENLAPDIHNDPVEVQADSTKYTRVGIAIDEADARQTIQLKVGEIGGEKQNIDLNFKY